MAIGFWRGLLAGQVETPHNSLPQPDLGGRGPRQTLSRWRPCGGSKPSRHLSTFFYDLLVGICPPGGTQNLGRVALHSFCPKKILSRTGGGTREGGRGLAYYEESGWWAVVDFSDKLKGQSTPGSGRSLCECVPSCREQQPQGVPLCPPPQTRSAGPSRMPRHTGSVLVSLCGLFRAEP